MAVIMNILLFLAYKFAEFQIAYWLVSYFNMRYDYLALLFYGILSIFQLLYFIFQHTLRNKKTGAKVVMLRYTSVMTIIMEYVIIATSVYYLRVKENDLMNLLFIVTVLSMPNTLFYVIHNVTFSSIIKKSKIFIKNTGFISYFLFVIFGFGIPLAYAGLKLFYFKKEIQTNDILLLSAVIGVNAVAILLLLFAKMIVAKRTVTIIENINIDLRNNFAPILDGNEYGYIQSGLKKLCDRLIRDKENITLLNQYISNNIKNQANQYGIEFNGEVKNATIATLLYNIVSDDMTPENRIRMERAITLLIGEYSDGYDAYPMFFGNRVVLIFGVPFFYDYQKYNALECCIEILSDIRNFAETEETEIKANIGIYSGPVICGAINTKGKDLNEYLAVGKSLENSEKLAAAAKKLNAKLIADDGTIKDLKSKFFVRKSYKIKLSDDESIIVNRLKV